MSHDPSDLSDYRRQAGAWVERNLDRQPPSAGSRRQLADDRTPEQMAQARVLQRRLFDGGFAGIAFPHEYGGQGLTPAHERVFAEVARGCVLPDFGGLGRVMFGPIGHSLLAHGTHALLDRFIAPLLRGDELWCQFYSEPDAGSDLAGIRTRATPTDGGWLLSGSKVWSTGAHHADYAMCLARSDWNVPKHQGLTWFAVPTTAPGVTIRPIRQINGNSGFCQAFLDDVVVGAENVIGEVNGGWSVTQSMLVEERGAGAALVPVDEPRRLAPDLVALAARSGSDDDPLIRQELARAHVNDFALYHLLRRVASRLGTPNAQPAVAAYAKLALGTLGPVRARIGVHIGGAAVLSPAADDPAPHDFDAIDYLNGRIMSIAGGTNEMQRNAIAERVLGLPREPTFDARKPFTEVLRAARAWDGRVG